MRRVKLTAIEVAEIIKECVSELPDDIRQSKTDWLVECLERCERNDSDPHASKFQAIRAELFRCGVKHTNQI